MADRRTYICMYDGAGWSIPPAFQKFADQEFVVGKHYHVIVEEERSEKSHRHYFAVLKDAWESLPDNLLEGFPNAEALRRWALCKGGFCDTRSIACAGPKEARAAFLALRGDYDYAVLRGDVVLLAKAHSQQKSKMGHDRFQASKDAVFRAVEDLLGMDHGTLTKQEKAHDESERQNRTASRSRAL